MTPPPNGFAHAKLIIENDSDPIHCWFNPKEYTIAKANGWDSKPSTGVAFPTPQFKGGQPRKLSLQLMFDSTDIHGPNSVSDVTARLFKAMEVTAGVGRAGQRNTARPPTITFHWGSVVMFKAVADNLSVQYTLFGANGTPQRAQAQLSLLQFEKAMDQSTQQGSSDPQNPTTRANVGLGAHTVRDGDSLASIAYEHYGDPTRWRAIAEANGIDDPLHLKRGSVLSIPRIEE
jgi:hypothetical protein